MGGGTHIEAPKPDPQQQAYFAYMLEDVKEKNRQAKAAADEEATQLTAIKNSGTAGFNTYKQNLLNQYNAGLITSDQAAQGYKDYEDRYKLGTGFSQDAINELTAAATERAPTQRRALAAQTYKDFLGRSAKEEELTAFEDLVKNSGGKYSLSDLGNTLKSSSEYQNIHDQNYLASYYDTMYGKQGTTTDEKGETVKTGKRTFNYNASLDPTFSGNIASATGVNTQSVPTAFTGTPAEIEEFQQAQRQKRDFMYNAGLTKLQGEIDQNVQKIKTEGSKEQQRIASTGSLLAGLTQGFWS